MNDNDSGLVLRLAGAFQSYGHAAAFHQHRDTLPFPTRSALIGMFAAAEGKPRTDALTPSPDQPDTPTYNDLKITVRIDRPGTQHTDFHTVGTPERAVRTSSGRLRPAAQRVLVSQRAYLADAVFTLAVTGPHTLTTRIAHALETPCYALSLGRRACVPEEPLVLRAHTTDPVGELLRQAPLSLHHPPAGETIDIDFVWETPPAPGPRRTTAMELADDPTDFHPERRTYRARPLWRTTEQLPARLYAGAQPIDRLVDYAHQEEQPCPARP